MGSSGEKDPGKGGGASRLLRWMLVIVQGGLLLLAWYYFSDRVRVSPGPLVAVHAREASLDGTAGCKVCHGPRNGACTADTCAACHAEIRDQIVAKKGFHGILGHDKVDDCGICHGEHKGPEFPAVNSKSFAQAGVPELVRYGHEGLDFRLVGKHRGLDCVKCHQAAEVRILEKGQRRYLGMVQDCASCHRDVHEGKFGKDCASCHGQEQAFKAAGSFHHTDAFPLEGSHSGLACLACHAEGSATSISVLVGSRAKIEAPAPVRTCGACHFNPHPEDFLARSAAASKVASAESCAVCHSASHPSFFGPAVTLTRRQHAATGFPLEVPHNKVACGACHRGFGTEFPLKDAAAYHDRYPGRKAEDCKACHGDPHRGEFEIGAFKGKDCLTCHTPKAFTPTLFDAARHDLTSFRLEGRHRKLQCVQCHEKGKAGEPPVYHGTPTDCRSCHKDPHGGQFNTPVYGGNDCRACHSQETFKPPTFTIAMHAKTSFPLTGAHLAISCTHCHEPSAKVAEIRVQQFTGVPGKCVSCHADVHAGKFDGPGVPATVAGRTDCARCHGTDSFRAFPEKVFDHPLWTGYALTGVHSKLECASCHGRNATDAGKGRTLGFAAGRSCQSCHTDIHAGQFGPTNSVSCTKCHNEEKTWHAISFNHQKDSRFKLDEVHVNLACVQCHKPMPVAPGTTAIRYKPLGIQCGDCHDPRGPKRQP